MTVLQRADIGEISEQARQVQFGHVALTLIASLLFAVGFVAYKTAHAVWSAASRILRGFWFGGVWVAVAVRQGWREARDGPAELLA